MSTTPDSESPVPWVRHKYPPPQEYGASEDFPSFVKRKYDDGANLLLSSAWSSMLSFAASGMGKGILMTAAITVAALTLAFPLFSMGGMAAGMSAGFGVLTGPVGFCLMAAGGAMGAVSEISHRRDQMTSLEADRLAQEYERSRAAKSAAHAGEKTTQPAHAEEMDITPGTHFRAQEQQRRSQQHISR
jgi:hypothetical protein